MRSPGLPARRGDRRLPAQRRRAGRSRPRPRPRGDRESASRVRWSSGSSGPAWSTSTARARRRRPSPQVAGHDRQVVAERGIDVVHGYEWPPAFDALLTRRRRRTAARRHRDVDVRGAVPARGRCRCWSAPRRSGDAALAAGHRRSSCSSHRSTPRSPSRPSTPATSATQHGLSPRRAAGRDGLPAGAGAQAGGPARRLRRGRRAGRGRAPGAAGDRRGRPLPPRTVRGARAKANARAGRRAVVLTGQLDDPRPAYAAADVMLGHGRLRAARDGVRQAAGRRRASRGSASCSPRRRRAAVPAPGLVRPGSDGSRAAECPRCARRSADLLADPDRRAPSSASSAGELVVDRFSLAEAAAAAVEACTRSRCATDPAAVDGEIAAGRGRPARAQGPPQVSSACAAPCRPTTPTPRSPVPRHRADTERSARHAAGPTEARHPAVDLAAQHAQVADEVAAGWAEVLRNDRVHRRPAGRPRSRRSSPSTAASRTASASATAPTRSSSRCARSASGPGDECVLPANTFIATAEAVARAGATPVLVDCDPRHALLDVDAAGGGGRPAHPGGPARCTSTARPRRSSSSRRIAARRRARRSSRTPPRPRAPAATAAGAGSLGDIAATSFYPGKNLGAYGDGGAVLTDDADAGRAGSGCWASTARRASTSTQCIGFNSRLDTLQAVVLSAKLRRLERWNDGSPSRRGPLRRAARTAAGRSRRPTVADGQRAGLAPLRRRGCPTATGCCKAAATRPASAPASTTRRRCTSPGAFADLGHGPGAFPVAERWPAELLSLPIFPEITPAQQERVVAVLAGGAG